MRNRHAWLRLAAALVLAWLPAGGALAAVPASTERFVQGHGREYGLSLDGARNLCYRKGGAMGVAAGRPEAIQGPALARLTALFERIQGQEPDKALVPVLKALVARLELGGRPLVSGEGQARALTQLGRNVLMDIMTARDGTTLSGPLASMNPAAPGQGSRVLERLMKEGAVLHLAEGVAQGLKTAAGAEASAAAGQAAYDQAGPGQAVYPVAAYGRWGDLARGRAGNVYRDGSGDLHLIVAANRAVKEDRYRVLDSDEEKKVLEESGLDGAILAKYGAKVARAVDNLIDVRVSEKKAAGLGRELEARGIRSRPDMAVEMARTAATGRMPLSGLLPFGRNILSRLTGGGFKPQSSEADDLLRAGGLWSRGMEGEGAVVGIIDSGLDMKHPDFKDRVLAYIDVSQAGKDAIGHGTHVAGLTGGDGAASGGKYRGMAPKAKFVVIQVFGAQGGGASEMSILLAMKIASSLPKNLRPDVINMSLGINPPIGNNLHSTSLLADWMMTRNNIFMSVAAGNSGAGGQYTIGAPGNARTVLTVTGTDKNKVFPFFPSRGPVVNWPFKEYNKPDIATIAGGVDRENPCPYAPGLIAARSGEENFPAGRGEECKLPDNPNYRYMSGTSMATPLATGIVADVIGYLKKRGLPYSTQEVKALIMETADDLGRPAWEQGAGLVNGERLAKTLIERSQAGIVAGNVAYMLSRQAGDFNIWYLAKYKGIVRTEAGLLDVKTQHLINSDAELDAIQRAIGDEFSSKPFWERYKIKLEYALARRQAEKSGRN